MIKDFKHQINKNFNNKRKWLSPKRNCKTNNKK